MRFSLPILSLKFPMTCFASRSGYASKVVLHRDRRKMRFIGIKLLFGMPRFDLYVGAYDACVINNVLYMLDSFAD